jgi:hypothetical protein
MWCEKAMPAADLQNVHLCMQMSEDDCSQALSAIATKVEHQELVHQLGLHSACWVHGTACPECINCLVSGNAAFVAALAHW